jgi:preprotein translocase subunit SecA
VINIDNKYDQWKPTVESLVHAQVQLCNRFLKEAEELTKKVADVKSTPEVEREIGMLLYRVKSGNPRSEGLMRLLEHPENLRRMNAAELELHADQSKKAADSKSTPEVEREIGMLLYRVKSGNPRSEGLMRLLEHPENLRRMNAAELELHADQSKKALYEEKEKLFYAMEEKSHDADLTEKGRTFLSPKDPDAFVLPDLITAFHEIDSGPEPDLRKRLEMKTQVQQQFEERAQQIHTISQLLKAYALYQKDVQYVVQDNKVIIVDENTGRLMTGRRWSDGLHQAVEAKEGVEIERETQTFATITIQNYFRLYHKLAGMTGTAETEAGEFLDIYKLGVLVIPTNRVVKRKDQHDTVYKTRREKFNAVLNEIKKVHAEGRPILVGTISVEVSEFLSRLLKKEGIPHAVLNAKYHQQEAEIVSRAGQKGAVTIATNMAGRGTDIKLGPGVTEIGGLHVVGTERHESRRIDRQLRGRCARQGDPGSSHFFISLEDDLMRLFGSDRIVKVMERVGLEENQELEHPLLNRSIETAQKRVEQHNFQARKRTLEYDDVMNKQREVIYGFRNEIIHADDVQDRLMDIMEEVVIQKVTQFSTSDEGAETWNLRGLADWVNLTFPLGMPEEEIKKAADSGTETPVPNSIYDGLSPAQFSVCIFISTAVRDAYRLKVSFENADALKGIERYTILSAIDKLWQEHLYGMDSLRNSIGLRAYGQRDPLIEYKAEAFKMFEELMVSIKTEICRNIFLSASSLMAFEQFLHRLPKQTLHQETNAFGGQTAANASSGDGGNMVSQANEAISKSKPIRSGPKVGRNDDCPCGSGKKYKNCCGKGL